MFHLSKNIVDKTFRYNNKENIFNNIKKIFRLNNRKSYTYNTNNYTNNYTKNLKKYFGTIRCYDLCDDYDYDNEDIKQIKHIKKLRENCYEDIRLINNNINYITNINYYYGSINKFKYKNNIKNNILFINSYKAHLKDLHYIDKLNLKYLNILFNEICNINNFFIKKYEIKIYNKNNFLIEEHEIVNNKYIDNNNNYNNTIILSHGDNFITLKNNTNNVNNINNYLLSNNIMLIFKDEDFNYELNTENDFFIDNINKFETDYNLLIIAKI